MDICSPSYDDLRALLIDQGEMTLRWMSSKFVESPDVTVGGKDHFLQLLDDYVEGGSLRTVEIEAATMKFGCTRVSLSSYNAIRREGSE